jgi:hypothetical protein
MKLLKKFKVEVCDQGPEACLPRNLPDDWLSVVARSTEDMVNGDSKGTGAIALAAIVNILCAKLGTEGVNMSHEELYQRLQDYRIELALEEVHRKTEVKYEAATLVTIFTHRDVKTWRVERSN